MKRRPTFELLREQKELPVEYPGSGRRFPKGFRLPGEHTRPRVW